VGIQLLDPSPQAVLVDSVVCVAQAIFLAVVTQVEVWNLSSISAPTHQKTLNYALRVIYPLMPIELPLAMFFAAFGVHIETVLFSAIFLLAASALIFFPHFTILRSLDRDKWQARPSGFPESSVRKAESLFASRFSDVAWYVPSFSRLAPEVLQVGAAQPMDPHAEEFIRIWRELHDDLPKIFRTHGPVVLLPRSGAGVMEIAIDNLLNPGDRVLVLNGGASGRLWSNIAREYGAEVVDFEIPYDRPAEVEAVAALIQSNAPLKAIFATLSEPENGAVQNVASFGSLVRHSETFFVVDVISGLAADEFRMDDWGVDVAVGVSHGGLMAPPGLGLIALNAQLARTISERSPLSRCPRRSSDLRRNLESRDRPDLLVPTQIAGALYLSTQMILAAGLDRIFEHRLEVATGFRRGCTEILNLPLVTANPTAACTTVKLPKNIKARQLQSVIRDIHAIGMAIGTIPTGEETLIIGHSGWIFRDDIFKAVEALAYSLQTLNEARPSAVEIHAA
jgi:aspartate aminotransferase-like enzyme